MVELTDTPIGRGNKGRRGQWLWVVLTAAGLLFTYVSWGKGAVIPVGNAQGLDVKIDFRGYDTVSKGGAFSYRAGKTLRYQVIVTNTSNSTLNGLELQTMVQGIQSRLPGAVISEPHKTTLAPGQTYRFDVVYETPAVKKTTQAHLVINAKYTQRGTFKADSFLCPTPVRFE